MGGKKVQITGCRNKKRADISKLMTHDLFSENVTQNTALIYRLIYMTYRSIGENWIAIQTH
jgi:hypothetical protein